MKKRMIIAFLLIATAGLVFSSCLVVARPRPVVTGAVVVGPPVEYGYQPMLYDGYVVYYTDDGIPFYWAGGVRVWVPIEYRTRYISHWRTHRHAYVKWHRHRGHHYRSRHYKSQRRPVKHGHGHGHGPVIKPKRHKGKPVIKPKEKSKPVIKPKKKKKKPVIKPK
jgi:hypothetical protein